MKAKIRVQQEGETKTIEIEGTEATLGIIESLVQENQALQNGLDLLLGPAVEKRLQDMTEPELSVMMKRAAAAARTALRPESLLVLLVFDDPAVTQYISNCDRGTMVEALRECASRIENELDVPR